MPVTAKPAASNARVSASPRPRDTPLTMAVFIRVAGVPRAAAMAAERECNDKNDDDGKDEQGDLDPALGILAGDGSGEAIHDCLKSLGAEVIAEQPYRRQNMLEGLTRIVGADIEIAVGVTRNLRDAHLTELRVHIVARGLRGRDQVDLISLDDPPRHIARVVGFKLRRRKWLDSTQQRRMHAHRRADQLVVKEMLELTRRALPSHMLNLARLRASAAVGGRFRRVVVEPRLGGPRRVDLRRASPARHA